MSSFGFFVDFSQVIENLVDSFNEGIEDGSIDKSADGVAYSKCFDPFYKRIQKWCPLSKNEVTTWLIRKRKQAKCPKERGIPAKPVSEKLRKLISSTYLAMHKEGRITRAVDRIAYTKDFERLYACINNIAAVRLSRYELYRILMNERRKGHCRTGMRDR